MFLLLGRWRCQGIADMEELLVFRTFNAAYPVGLKLKAEVVEIPGLQEALDKNDARN